MLLKAENLTQTITLLRARKAPKYTRKGVRTNFNNSMRNIACQTDLHMTCEACKPIFQQRHSSYENLTNFLICTSK